MGYGVRRRAADGSRGRGDAGAGIAAKYVEGGWAGGPSQVGKFTFTPNGVTDINRYRYSFNSSTYTGEVTAGTGGAGTVAFAPASPGLNTLRVWPVDNAGWVGPARTYQFWVYAAPKAAWWLLDGNGNDSATGGVNPVTVSDTTTWVDGPLVGEYPNDKALHLTGAGTGAATGGPVVHSAGSFTVTALVNTADVSSTRMAVSQDGMNISGFKLGQLRDSTGCSARLGTACWAFWVADQDSSTSSQTKVMPTIVAGDEQHFAIQPDTWTALAGVYDATAHQLRLYVNGELAGSTPYTASWDAVGPLRIGGTAGYFWSGDLDDVRVYRTALDLGTILRIARGSRNSADIPQ